MIISNGKIPILIPCNFFFVVIYVRKNLILIMEVSFHLINFPHRWWCLYNLCPFNISAQVNVLLCSFYTGSVPGLDGQSLYRLWDRVRQLLQSMFHLTRMAEQTPEIFLSWINQGMSLLHLSPSLQAKTSSSSLWRNSSVSTPHMWWLAWAFTIV